MKPGAVITEPGSTVRNKTGGWRVFRPVFNMERCIDCGNCWIYCPEACVSKSEEGEYSADLEYCKGCGICANECPTEAIEMQLEEK
jgi:pyruvate ferredoxin oxidoreductase delta subunit